MKNQKYLFVCKHNFTRSKFGAEFFERYLKKNNLKGEVFSRGIGWSANFFGKRIAKKDLEGIKRIFVMEDYMKNYLVKKFGFNNKKIVVLGIKDIYGFFGKKTIKELKENFKRTNWKEYL